MATKIFALAFGLLGVFAALGVFAQDKTLKGVSSRKDAKNREDAKSGFLEQPGPEAALRSVWILLRFVTDVRVGVVDHQL